MLKKSTKKKDIKIPRKSITLDDLAVMVAKGFEQTSADLSLLDVRINRVENHISEIRENLKATRRDVLSIGDRFVPRFEFDNLLIRVGRLEQRVSKPRPSK